MAIEIGPVVARGALERIGRYLGKAPDFPTIEKAEQYIREVSAPFGRHTDAEWRFLTEIWQITAEEWNGRDRR